MLSARRVHKLLFASLFLLANIGAIAAPTADDVKSHLAATIPPVLRIVRLEHKVFPSVQQAGSGRVSVAFAVELTENLYQQVDATKVLNDDLVARGLPQHTGFEFLPREIREGVRGLGTWVFIHEIGERKGSRYDYTTELFYREKVKGFEFSANNQISQKGMRASEIRPASIERNSQPYKKLIADASTAWALFSDRMTKEKGELAALFQTSGSTFVYQAETRSGNFEDVFRLRVTSPLVWVPSPRGGPPIFGGPAVRFYYEMNGEITWLKSEERDSRTTKQDSRMSRQHSRSARSDTRSTREISPPPAQSGPTPVLIGGMVSGSIHDGKWLSTLEVFAPDRLRPGQFDIAGKRFVFIENAFEQRDLGGKYIGKLTRSQ